MTVVQDSQEILTCRGTKEFTACLTSPVPVLSQMNPMHKHPHHLCKINYITLPSMPRSIFSNRKWFFSPSVRSVWTTDPFSLIWSLTNTWWWEQIMELLTVQFSSVSCHFTPLWSKQSPKNPVLKHPNSCSSLKVAAQVSHSGKAAGAVARTKMCTSRASLSCGQEENKCLQTMQTEELQTQELKLEATKYSTAAGKQLFQHRQHLLPLVHLWSSLPPL
jgi:hypothetical protein